jgi:hypothetical protein
MACLTYAEPASRRRHISAAATSFGLEKLVGVTGAMRCVLKQPPQRLKAEQQAAGHLVGSRCGDYVLVRCQDIAQAAIERSLLIDRRAACRFVDELNDFHAKPNAVGI